MTIDAQSAVKKWVFAKHNEYEETVIHRLLDLAQIERAWFSAADGWAYSQYTSEGPSVVVEYTYIDNIGKKHDRSIDVDGVDVGAFVAELVELL